MRVALPLAVLLAAVLQAQEQPEKPVDANSERVSITGCVRGKNLVVVEPAEHEPINVRLMPGRVFRLSGPKAVMKDLGKREGSVVAVTGLVRKSALDPSTQGIGIGAGGRIRIGGGPPVSSDPTRSPGRDPLANVQVMDVESFRPAEGTCPAKR
jgi:hypothetical protein